MATIKLIKWAEKNPKNLFLIDGMGAILSAFLLGIVFVHWQRFFGIPVASLYFLAGFPILFFVFDLYSFLKKPESIISNLRFIGAMNLFYCILSIGVGLSHLQDIRVLGWIYLIIEIFVVATLALYELKIAKNLKLKSGLPIPN